MSSSTIASNAHVDFCRMERQSASKGQVQLLSPEEVALLLQVSKSMVYKLVRGGRLEAVHVGRLVRIAPKSYEDLLARRGA
ncbi:MULTISPECIES: helix-turn-helix domain-containing protein [unclassified Adlercreutzia]|uniref:helix-turn-helix domain-containing protein n=1 Tax=unclassified Adlercreutzia TaxID=2636013 RepID=UPI0019813193|nr:MULTISPECIES: helix-turn-helix domain-containing protein [unclassified Adlercreutzia]